MMNFLHVLVSFESKMSSLTSSILGELFVQVCSQNSALLVDTSDTLALPLIFAMSTALSLVEQPQQCFFEGSNLISSSSLSNASLKAQI